MARQDAYGSWRCWLFANGLGAKGTFLAKTGPKGTALLLGRLGAAIEAT